MLRIIIFIWTTTDVLLQKYKTNEFIDDRQPLFLEGILFSHLKYHLIIVVVNSNC